MFAGALFGMQSAQAALPIQHWVQPSGVAVYLVESPVVPMLDVRVDFDAGARRDPAPQAGLATVTNGMMSKGVRATGHEPALDENALGEAWADLGAVFGGNAGSDRMSFALRSLTYPELLARAVALAARQLATPSFPVNVWERERERLSAAIREANTRPGTVAARAFAQAVFGAHPYGYEMTEATLARITVADMQALHARLLQPCRAKVSIVGAVTRAQADALVQQLFAPLVAAAPAGNCEALPPVDEVKPLAAAAERNIPFDSAQAHVLIGQPGFKSEDPDFFPLTVGNYILGGGGFVSRLMTEVREKRGLTYGIYSGFSAMQARGPFMINLQTRAELSEGALTLVQDILRDYLANGPTQKELDDAKRELAGSFPLSTASNADIVGQLGAMGFYDLPLTYLEDFMAQIQALSAEQVKTAMAKHLSPEAMLIVSAGPTVAQQPLPPPTERPTAQPTGVPEH